MRDDAKICPRDAVETLLYAPALVLVARSVAGHLSLPLRSRRVGLVVCLVLKRQFQCAQPQEHGQGAGPCLAREGPGKRRALCCGSALLLLLLLLLLLCSAGAFVAAAAAAAVVAAAPRPGGLREGPFS
jgi:hypothetical protein